MCVSRWEKSSAGGYCYRYNGKELNEDVGLYEYGFRWYDPAIGRFTGVDPISDQFPHVSTYNYAENEPIGSIDLHGLQRVRVNDIRNSSGEVVRRKVSVTYNQKVLNLSSKENYQLKAGIARGNKSFAGAMSGQSFAQVNIGGELTKGKIPIDVEVSVETQMINSVDQISDGDHVMVIADGVSGESGTNTEGVAELSGNVAVVEADQIVSSSGEVMAHEMGHNAGLDFSHSGGDEHTANGSGLMGANVNGQVSLSDKKAKSNYHTGIGARANPSVSNGRGYRQHPNTLGRLRSFFRRNVNDHDRNKTKKSGM